MKSLPYPIRFAPGEHAFLEATQQQTGLAIPEIICRSVRFLRHHHSTVNSYSFIVNMDEYAIQESALGEAGGSASQREQTTDMKAEEIDESTLPATPAGRTVETLGYNGRAAARICGVSYWTLWRDTKLGKVRRTSRGIYPREELMRYLKEDLINNPTAPIKPAKSVRPTKPKENKRFIV